MCCRTGTYFCMDKSVTAVVIKVCPVPSCSHLQILVNNQCVHRVCLMMLTTTLAAAWQGLAEHKDELGAPLCPCRHYDDKQMEAQQGFWNCPCVPMRERKASIPTAVSRCLLSPPSLPGTSQARLCGFKEYLGMQECHCMLFLTEDNSFRGEDTSISLDEVIEATKVQVLLTH